MAIYQGSRGLQGIAELLGTMPEKLRKADRRAQTSAARRAKVIASRRIRKNLNLGKPYVDKKMWIRRISANEINLEAERRGVLMTRFAHTPVFRTRKGGKKPAGYRVRITRQGGAVHLRHVYPVRLRAGKVAGTNIGLGQRVEGKTKVLHAPSVSQAFGALMEEIADPVNKSYADLLETEIGKI